MIQRKNCHQSNLIKLEKKTCCLHYYLKQIKLKQIILKRMLNFFLCFFSLWNPIEIDIALKNIIS